MAIVWRVKIILHQYHICRSRSQGHWDILSYGTAITTLAVRHTSDLERVQLSAEHVTTDQACSTRDSVRKGFVRTECGALRCDALRCGEASCGMRQKRRATCRTMPHRTAARLV